MGRVTGFLWSQVLVVSVGLSSLCGESPPLWVYVSTNFQVDQSTDELITLLQRAKAAGYTGAVVTDYKFGKLDDRIERYYHNLRRARQTAEQLDIELIPCVMPIGYSNSVLQNDPNLAAALPVKDCTFVAGQSTASVADTSNLLPGGEFELAERNRPAGWDWIDGFGASTTLDTETKQSGNSSLRMRDFNRGSEAGNCRVVRSLKLQPYHQYRLTMWVKTDQWAGGEFKVMPLADGHPLNYADLGVKPTQDWTRHRIVFNSLEHDDVSLYVGLWGASGGTVWIDDLRLEVVGGVNLLRRGGCPIRVTSDDGQVEYAEGRDFEPWSDPKLGSEPFLGEYSDDHDAPLIKLTGESRVRSGQRLRVSFYHTSIIHDGQVCCSLVSDELFKHLRRQVELLHEYWKPNRYFMQHDEIRLAGHDRLSKGRPSGELLAENVRRCVQLIRSVNPQAELVVWSDMFDPHHNARDHYYLASGTMRGSWEGLDSSVTIANWNSSKAGMSLQWFADRGHAQVIAGYYDGDVTANVKQWRQAASEAGGVSGYMYTTWRGNYDDLETFAKLAQSK